MLAQLAKIKGAALNLLLPQKCIGCGKEGEPLCDNCLKGLPRITPPVCPRCGRPQPSGIICPGCVNWQASIDGIRSPLRFGGLVRESIHQIKYKNLHSLCQPMSRILRDHLVQNPLPCQVLVPVPLHSQRMKERGYNQSALLARELSKLTQIPVNESCLQRVKFILPQAKTLSVEERRQNVRDAFCCRNSELKGQHILLIDDVSTSGATLDACASALKSAGAITVYGLALAREI